MFRNNPIQARYQPVIMNKRRPATLRELLTYLPDATGDFLAAAIEEELTLSEAVENWRREQTWLRHQRRNQT